ncbi:hypothetical protein HAX54_003655 [Datura stramonium]|uniref:Uncharacterized protein n=1 Tax=Datura stramonium TaxID=4076 RepID=A0ABS8T6F9_DATST|nr:hypothetical protein [Datura stramonium]
MILIDLIFHHGDIVNEFNGTLGYVGAQQLIVVVPSRKYYEIESDDGITTLLSFINKHCDVIILFVVEDGELDIDIDNIVQHKEIVLDVDEETTDCSSHGSNHGSDEGSDYSNYDSEEFEAFTK